MSTSQPPDPQPFDLNDMNGVVPTEAGIINPETLGNDEEAQNRLRNVLHVGRMAGETTVAVALLSPLNEGIRGAAFTAALVATHDANVATGVLMGTNLAVEMASTVTTSDLLASETAKKAMERANSVLERVGLSRDAKSSPGVKTAVAAVAGSGVVIALKHREDPERTRLENVKYGTRASIGLTAMVGVLGYLTAHGIEHPDPASIAVAGLGVLGFANLLRYAKKTIKKSNTQEELTSDHDSSGEEQDKVAPPPIVMQPRARRTLHKSRKSEYKKRGSTT